MAAASSIALAIAAHDATTAQVHLAFVGARWLRHTRRQSATWQHGAQGFAAQAQGDSASGTSIMAAVSSSAEIPPHQYWPASHCRHCFDAAAIAAVLGNAACVAA
jgi:hypothetical protein